MSRLIVKNLPKTVNKENLAEIFGSHGEITDLRLCKTKSGEFRKFGFVGYKTEGQATSAQKSLHRSYIKTSKIQVEIAKNIGDETVPRPWSKHSSKSSAFARSAKEVNERKKRIKHLQEGNMPVEHNKNADGSKIIKNENVKIAETDDHFTEFLKAHVKKSIKKTWDNEVADIDENVCSINSKKKSDKKSVQKQAPKKQKGNTLDEKPEFEDEENGNSNDEDQDTDDDNQDLNKDCLGIPEISNASNLANHGASDLDWLKSKAKKDDVMVKKKTFDSNSQDEVAENELDDGDSSDSTDEDREYYKNEGTSDSCKKYSLTIKMRGIPFKCTEKDIISFFSQLRIIDIRIPLNDKKKAKGTAYVDFEDETGVLEAMTRNKQNIKGRYIELFRMDALESFAESSNPREDVMPWENKVSNEDEEDEAAEDSGRLFIRNLSYTCEEKEIKELFEKYGPIAEVHLPIDKTTKRITGIGFVTFVMPEHAVKALNELDGIVFQGRLLHVLPARTKKIQTDGHNNELKTSYKKEKDAKIKSLSGSGHNWNSLFLGQNAVVDVLAQKMNTNKSKILDTEDSDSLAVRMALGETQIVAETREFLVTNGVKLDVFGQPGTKKSDKVILVKNLPQGTKTEELRNIFGKFGDIDRLLLPPSGISAIVEFLQPTEARTAFRSLAYTKFKHLPLYLEWAPFDVFSGEMIMEDEDNKEEKEAKDELNNEEQDTQDSSCRTIFVKNLNFSTTEESLRETFQECGEISSVTIAQKKDPKRPKELLSMGYGFIEYSKSINADEAIKTLQHTMLDNHQLELKKSHRKSQVQDETRKKSKSKKQKTSKILVRNIPFEATKKEIQQLFGAFGEIKTLRLPKKMTGTHRGFVFVDYLTKQDAKRAFKALCQSTHLYGRRLVLEWAEDDDTVDSIRQRTAMHFHDEPAQKRSKQDLLDTLENPLYKSGVL